MYPIVKASWLAPRIKRFEIQAPRIAARQRAGQFVIVRVHDRGERIPLTIVGSDSITGRITLVVQEVGKTTRMMNQLQPGDSILDVVGPLGRPSDIPRNLNVVSVAGGVGAAICYPTVKALKANGCQVTSILGAREASLLILESEFRTVSDRLRIATDDGSRGMKGVVTDLLRELLDSGPAPDYVFAVGPVSMMQAVAEATRPKAIPTAVSLNPIMIDGTGMCGGCRVRIAGKTRFACVEGPEFNAHDVDFLTLKTRNRAYCHAERQALERFEAELASTGGAAR